MKTGGLGGAGEGGVRGGGGGGEGGGGGVSSLLALIALTLVLWEINQRFPELGLWNQTFELMIVFVGIFVLGISITGLSTFFATQRYLNLKTDAVY